MVHDFADFPGMRFRKGPSEYREVLAEDENGTAVDGAMPGDHAVARHRFVSHIKVGTSVLDENVPLLKTVLVQQHTYAFSRGQLALGMLGVNTSLTSSLTRGFAAPFQFLENLSHQWFASVTGIRSNTSRAASRIGVPGPKNAATPSAESASRSALGTTPPNTTFT